MNLIYVLFCFFCLPSLGFSTSQPKVEDAGSEMPRENMKGEKATIPAVEELTSSTVDSAIRRDRSIWLIEFYAPWCHHCTAFASNYESLARRIHSSNDSRDRPIRVAKINGSQERSAASRFSVRGYPSFFVIDGWSVYEYQGRRSEESLMKFVVHEEYKNQHPLPIWASPLGPVGQIHALVTSIGNVFYGMYNYLVSKQGFSPSTAAFIFAFSGMFSGLGIMIVVAILLSSKLKED